MTDLSGPKSHRSDRSSSKLMACYQQLRLGPKATAQEVDTAYFQLRAECLKAGDRAGIIPLQAARNTIKRALTKTQAAHSTAQAPPKENDTGPAIASFDWLVEAFAQKRLAAKVKLSSHTLSIGITENPSFTPSQITAMVKQVLSEVAVNNATLQPAQTIRVYGLGKNNQPLWRKTFPRPQPQITADELDLGSFRNRFSTTVFFPGLLILGALLNVLEPIRLLLFGIDIWIHEFGHATVAWLGGYQATPLPFGWTNIGGEQSLFVYFGVLILLGLLFWTGLKEQRRWPMGLAVVLAIIQFVMTWMISVDTFEMLVSFGGIGGEFYLSTLLIVGFYFPLPAKWHWELYRYPVVVCASFTFWGSFWHWRQIKRGLEAIPWGSLFGGAEHIGGDMNQLSVVYGWSDQLIIDVYNRIGGLCAIAILSIYLYFFIRQRSHLWLYRLWLSRANTKT